MVSRSTLTCGPYFSSLSDRTVISMLLAIILFVSAINELTLSSRVPLKRPEVVQPFVSSQHFMEPEGSLPSSQEFSMYGNSHSSVNAEFMLWTKGVCSRRPDAPSV
jgi:hypothetical protein